MAGRKRTAKSLGQRHDLHYFQKWGRWRVLRAALMIAFPAIAGVWLLGYALHRDAAPYSSGPLSTVHSFTGKRCETCHAPVLKAGFVSVGFRKHVTDEACLTCHQAPEHQAALQTFTPTCASCHTEHIGSQHLRQTAAETCVQCHGDLKVKSGAPHYQSAIYNFEKKHPEFAPLRNHTRDAGTIKLNHAVHMRAGLLGPNSQPVQLQCQDCHRTPAEQHQPWKYGEPSVIEAALHSENPHSPMMPPETVHPGTGRAHMAAPSYATACQSCHALQFDRYFSESVPHDKPQVVHDFIVSKLTEYIKKHPDSLGVAPRPMRIMFGGTISREPQSAKIAHSAEEWVKLRTADAENLLWHKTCQQCHTLKYPQSDQNGLSGLPEVAPSNIKPVWLPNAIFSHYAHLSLDCKSCHTRTITSMETADVLIPSVGTCQECHNGEPTKIGQAQNGCFLCHQYHGWKQRSGPFTPTKSIDQVRGAYDGRGPSPVRRETATSIAKLFLH
ncbi:MAG TPA: cytochrome c3 family protein [Terriglobales bacterium]|jgi:hypothetical protein|nr:cytochrome c3 family protein [Terriglobales bacterium]